MSRILVTGALGQIGTELTAALRARHGADAVVATDLREPAGGAADGLFAQLDVTDDDRLAHLVREFDVGQIVHLAALLSATGEKLPTLAWRINVGGLFGVLEVAREHECAVFTPSSIAAFGPGTPSVDTPQDTVQRPTTMYGVTRQAMP